MDVTSFWLTPLILLPGVALLILSTSFRFNRLHDELHALMHHEDEASASVTGRLVLRARLFRNTLVALYVCVALFSLASLLGMGATLWETEQETSVWIVLGTTSIGVVSLTFAAFQLIRESLLALDIITTHTQALRHDADRTRSKRIKTLVD